MNDEEWQEHRKDMERRKRKIRWINGILLAMTLSIWLYVLIMEIRSALND